MSAVAFETTPEIQQGVEPKIPQLAVLATEARQEQLKTVCRQVLDLRGKSPADIVSGFGGGLLLLEQGAEGWEQIILGLAVDRPDTAVLLASDQLPGHIVRALMKLEASDILPMNASPQDVVAAIDRLRESMDAPEEKKESSGHSVCWAFRGAVGGAGASTLAIESAFEIARRVGPEKVCLVDLNVADGMLMSFLEGVPKFDLAALSEAPERLDERLLAAWCWKHEDGVSVIAASRNPDADVLATESAILRLLDVACNVFEYVLLDMPRHMMPWTKPVLGAVDEAIVVSELTVPSLHAAADTCRETDILRDDTHRTRLVLNRMFPKKRFRAEFAVEKAEKAIDRKINHTITSDWDAARTAVNLGKPIAEVKPKSPLVSDVSKLVSLLKPDLTAETYVPNTKKRSAR